MPSSRAETDKAVRVIVLRGEGDMFTAGNDVAEFAMMATGAFKGERHVSRFLDAITRSTRPLVAAVQGRAVGIGTTMLLHCDFVVLAEDAQLSTPFVSLALVPEAASTLLMPLRIGYARAYEMFALGEAVDAQTALRLGIANRVVPLAKLHAEAASVAARLAKQPAGSLSRNQAADAQCRDAGRADRRRKRDALRRGSRPQRRARPSPRSPRSGRRISPGPHPERRYSAASLGVCCGAATTTRLRPVSLAR